MQTTREENAKVNAAVENMNKINKQGTLFES